jgi:hypothetical protein
MSPTTETIPEPQQASYAGWIPTITGHLSFGMIGQQGLAWSHANAESRDEDGLAVARHVLVHCRRTARDLPYTHWPVTWIVPSIRSDFFMLGMTEQAARPVLDASSLGRVLEAPDAFGVLRGEVVMIPHHENGTLRRHITDVRNDVRRLLLRFSDLAPEPAPVDILTLYRKVDERLQKAEQAGVVLVRAKFDLYRTGELRIQMPSLPPTEPSSQGISATRQQDLLARKIYYFSKDAAHRHFHHHPDTDNLTPLTRIVSNDDESWRRETLWGLARAVLEVRRRNQLSDFQGAVGMLAYADAFQALLARVKRGDNGGFQPAPGIAPYDFAHTRSSLDALIEDQRWRTSGWAQFWTVVASVLLAVIALWIGAVQIQSSACHAVAATVGNITKGVTETCSSQELVPPWAGGLVLRIVRDPAGTLAIFSLLALVYFEFTRRSLRAATAGRLLITSPLEWLVALGSTVSRALRNWGILWGDRIAKFISVFVSSILAGTLMNLFYFTLTRGKADLSHLIETVIGRLVSLLPG